MSAAAFEYLHHLQPFAQPEFAAGLLDGARARGIRTAVETCGFAPAAVFTSLAAKADVHAQDRYGNSALMFTTYSQDAAMAELLVLTAWLVGSTLHDPVKRWQLPPNPADAQRGWRGTTGMPWDSPARKSSSRINRLITATPSPPPVFPV